MLWLQCLMRCLRTWLSHPRHLSSSIRSIYSEYISISYEYTYIFYFFLLYIICERLNVAWIHPKGHQCSPRLGSHWARSSVMDLQTLAEQLAALDEQSAVSVVCSVLESRPELAPSVVAFSVPDLTYAPIRALTERRSEGHIKTFNQEKASKTLFAKLIKAQMTLK